MKVRSYAIELHAKAGFYVLNIINIMISIEHVHLDS